MLFAPIAEDHAPLALGEREIHLWSIPLDVGAEALPGLTALLCEGERERARRYVFETVQRRFVVGRAALRILLGRYLDMPGQAIRFCDGTSGKPYLSARCGASLHFNVSHSHGLALFAFCAEEELGIDVQFVYDIPDSEGIVRRFFCPEEIEEWMGLPMDRRPRAFFDCWTRKEAYLKALGRGLELPLDAFQVAFRPGEAPAVRSRGDRHGEQWSMFDVSPAEQYSGALAVRSSLRSSLHSEPRLASQPSVAWRRADFGRHAIIRSD